jgi:hypothetical protein
LKTVVIPCSTKSARNTMTEVSKIYEQHLTEVRN